MRERTHPDGAEHPDRTVSGLAYMRTVWFLQDIYRSLNVSPETRVPDWARVKAGELLDDLGAERGKMGGQ